MITKTKHKILSFVVPIRLEGGRGVSENLKGRTESSKLSYLFPCSSKSFLNYTVSSTMFPFNLFLVKHAVKANAWVT